MGPGSDPGPTVSYPRRSDSHDHRRSNWHSCSGPPRLREPAQAALAPYLFVLPFFVVFVAMLVVPLGYAAWTSLFRSRLIGGKVFAGLDNFTRALTDPGFLEGLRRVALILLVQVPIMLGLALVSRSFSTAGAPTVRAPYVCSSSCRMRCQVSSRPSCGVPYGRDFGPIGQAFRAVGLEAPNFFSEQNMLGAIITSSRGRLLATTW